MVKQQFKNFLSRLNFSLLCLVLTLISLFLLLFALLFLLLRYSCLRDSVVNHTVN